MFRTRGNRLADNNGEAQRCWPSNPASAVPGLDATLLLRPTAAADHQHLGVLGDEQVRVKFMFENIKCGKQLRVPAVHKRCIDVVLPIVPQ